MAMRTLFERLSAAPAQPASFWRIPGRIAYVVNHSYPYSSNGYAVRTHGVASALVAQGCSVMAINRPGHPWDLPGFNDPNFKLHHEIDGVRYLSMRTPSAAGRPLPEYLAAAADALQKLFRLFKPSVVMAASNWENALPAGVAARALGLPFFYEVRGFWEISRISREPTWEQTEEFRQAVARESAVAKAADRVFTLNRFMREELVRRGVEASRIDLAPNGYGALPDLSRPPRLSRADVGCDTRYVVGYVGSFNEYEGLDDLVRACAQLRRQGVDMSLLLVGSSHAQGLAGEGLLCPVSQRLRQLAGELGFAEFLALPGRVAPEALADYYALIDLVVIPRKPLPVCELVSPIKPLEAMAFGKPLLVSSVGPLREVVEQSAAGRCFQAGNVGELGIRIAELLVDEANRLVFGQAARRWVGQQQNWWRATTAILGTRPLRLRYPSILIRNENRFLRVACIMDDFTFHSFDSECILEPLTPEHALDELQNLKPHLLFVESAWRGKDELWNRKISNISYELRNVIDWCKSRGIPTIFWNKEDPVHFETFINTAQLFDHVFTTDIDCIHRYKAALQHDRVYFLPFACQPVLHNPIEVYERKDAFCFAGAYYVRYPERIRDLGDFVNKLPKFRPLEIFDRNFGKDDPNYQFPSEYQPYIVGTLPFSQIDQAYKGYRYAINLNSIKHSQSMFARRVYELLGSNTITVSNFSRGLRMLFGDLVITTDSGDEVVRRLRPFADHEEAANKLRLAALRKVMQEHTYTHRLAYVVTKALNRPMVDPLPNILILARAVSLAEYQALIAHFQCQQYVKRRMVMVLVGDIGWPTVSDERITGLSETQAAQCKVNDVVCGDEWIAPIVAEDYYGPNYLVDLALATRYSSVKTIGKAAYYLQEKGGVYLVEGNNAYHWVSSLMARCSIIESRKVVHLVLGDWLKEIASYRFDSQPCLAIDPFNYCRDTKSLDLATVEQSVNDLQFNTGIPVDLLLARAEQIRPLEQSQSLVQKLTAHQLVELFGVLNSQFISSEIVMRNWRITSNLDDNKHEYFYAAKELALNDLGFEKEIRFYFDVSLGLNIKMVIFFLDAHKNKINYVLQVANHNQTVTLPLNAVFIRLGLRIYGNGYADIKSLFWGHLDLQPVSVISQNKYLLVTHNYPEYLDLYRNAFVHTRVIGYQQYNLKTDVFRFRKNGALGFHEFQNVDVVTGNQGLLDKMLAAGQYKSILVHFMNPDIWEILGSYVNSLKIIVWVHGFEIHAWWRRQYNYLNEFQLEKAKKESEIRMNFWRNLLRPMPENLKLVFVSRYFAEEVMEDLGFRIPESHYRIIHNPIDTNFFSYREKPVEQRKKILSIRPYASKTYANDLTAKAIHLLSEKPFFKDLYFHLIGDGVLFDEITTPLQKFDNVFIQKGFLTHLEIAQLHQKYGIFLCPSRMDTQGVSRDEAMSSGLVPVTNKVGAIPEFVDENCGILAEPEDAEGIASGIEYLIQNPEQFSIISKNAADRVRMQASKSQIIKKEISEIEQDYNHSTKLSTTCGAIICVTNSETHESPPTSRPERKSCKKCFHSLSDDPLVHDGFYQILPTDKLPSHELQNAKDFWRNLNNHSTFTEKQSWCEIICESILKVKPKSVFEFGCNAGKNLDQLKNEAPNIFVSGIDINQSSIYLAQEKGLNVHTADEKLLSIFPNCCFDVSFTVSVLDHIPDPAVVLKELLRISRCAVFLLEPWLGQEGKVVKNYNRSLSKIIETTPFSYSWNYLKILDKIPDWTYEHKKITLPTNLGAYYYLYSIFRKVNISNNL